MLSSVTKCFLCCITRSCRNKIVIENHSNAIVQYEAYIYRSGSISKVNGGVGAMGVDAQVTMEMIQAEGLKPSTGKIQPYGKAIETCDYGGVISLRYKFQLPGLEDEKSLDKCDTFGFSPELRNFGVLDTVHILPPTKKEIDEMKRRYLMYLEMLDTIRAAEACARLEAELKINTERECSSGYQHTCSARDTPKIKCNLCGDWYCNNHIEAKTKWSVFGGVGGHVCPKYNQYLS